MLRPEWRLWPISTFLGLLDLKTGVTIALLFAVSCVPILHPQKGWTANMRMLNRVVSSLTRQQASTVSSRF